MSAALQRTAVIAQLQEQPWRFQFCQAVALALAWLEGQGVAPERGLTTHLVFDNPLSFSFAPAQVAGCEIDPGEEGQAPTVHLTPAFMGFLGVNGTLPFHYTETIQAHLATTRDAAPRAFLDMFSSRALAQFYLAWCKHRVEHVDLGHGEAFRELLLAFAGRQCVAAASTGDMACAIDSGTLAQYAGVLLQRPLPAQLLARLLGDYLGLPVTIRESTGDWIGLHEHEQCALGGSNIRLGSNTLLGQRSWRPDLAARICIGPLARADFLDCLPGGACARVLVQLLHMLASPTVGYDVQLILKGEDVHPLTLPAVDADCARLGQDSFLVPAADHHDRGDVSYRIALLAPLPPLSIQPSQGATP